MSKNHSMKYQAKTILATVQCYGRSKHLDKSMSNHHHPHGIYSVKTYEQYVEHCTRFGEWCKVNYGKKDLKECREYIREYLDEYSQGKSPWSIRTVKYALQKLYDAIDPGFKVYYDAPKRQRVDIVKNRTPIAEVKGFNYKKYKTELNFGCVTGARKSAMLKLRYSDIYEKDGAVYVHFHKDKGGKTRDVKILDKYAKFIKSFIGKGAPDENIFKSLPCRFPEHSCRRFFANDYYNTIARNPNTLPKSEKYICRKDKSGIEYDRKAMLEVSEALGHGRVDVMALHYLD